MIQFIFLSVILFLFLLAAAGQDGVVHRRAAKIRVPVSDRRRQRSRPAEEEELDARPALAWMGLAAVIFFVLLVVSRIV